MILSNRGYKERRVLYIKRQTAHDFDILLQSNLIWRRIKLQPTHNVVIAKVMELLQKNRDSLVEVSCDPSFWTDNAIWTMTLPFLQSFSATTSVWGQNSLNVFLLNHPHLEEIDIAIRQHFGSFLFDVIKQRSAKLKKLHLKAKKFIDFNDETDEFIDWTFRGSMTQLTDFQLSRPYCKNANWEAYGSGRRILESLPKNQLVSLRLRGFGLRNCGF